MRTRKITGRILTGLALLISTLGTVTVANEINNIASNINVKSVKSNIVEKNGRYYVQLTTDRDVKNAVARITTEDKKDYLFKKDNIKAGEVVEYEIDINADVPTKKLPHTGVIKETVKNVVNVGNHTFNITVRYDVEVEDNAQPIMQITKMNITNPTLDQLIYKKEMSAEERLQEAEAKAKQEGEAKAKQETEAKAKQEAEAKAKQEAEVKAKQEAEVKAKQEAEAKVKQEAEEKAKQEAEAKAKQEAEAKQGITVANGLPPVTVAELADPAMNGLTDHAKKMKVALAKKFGITSFSMFRAGDDDGTGHGHNTGMSVDFMVPVGSAKGDELAEYITKNMNELGIYYIIWKQRFYMPQYNMYGPANTWNLMPDRGGVTANHYDHVHVSFVK